MAMYNNLQAEKSKMKTPTRKRDNVTKEKKSSAPKRSTKNNSSKGTMTQKMQASGTPF